jgi:hypothetical protein
MDKTHVAPLELAAFVAAPREWTASFSTPEMALSCDSLDELTVDAARSLSADVVLIEFDTLDDREVLAILAACPTAVRVGLTDGLPNNQIRVVELLFDRVAQVDSPPMVIAWTVWSAVRQAHGLAADSPSDAWQLPGATPNGPVSPPCMSQEHWKSWRRLDGPEPMELLCEMHARSSADELDWGELELN